MNLRTDVPGGARDACVSEKHDAQIEADGRVIENISWAIRQTPDPQNRHGRLHTRQSRPSKFLKLI